MSRRPRTEKEKKARRKEYAKNKRARRVIPNQTKRLISVDLVVWKEFQEICKTDKKGVFSPSWHIYKWMKNHVRKTKERRLRENYWEEIERRYG